MRITPWKVIRITDDESLDHCYMLWERFESGWRIIVAKKSELFSMERTCSRCNNFPKIARTSRWIPRNTQHHATGPEEQDGGVPSRSSAEGPKEPKNELQDKIKLKWFSEPQKKNYLFRLDDVEVIILNYVTNTL